VKMRTANSHTLPAGSHYIEPGLEWWHLLLSLRRYLEVYSTFITNDPMQPMGLEEFHRRVKCLSDTPSGLPAMTFDQVDAAFAWLDSAGMGTIHLDQFIDWASQQWPSADDVQGSHSETSIDPLSTSVVQSPHVAAACVATPPRRQSSSCHDML
jgi:hypothetical protein